MRKFFWLLATALALTAALVAGELNPQPAAAQTVTNLTNDVAASGGALAQGTDANYKISVPSGQDFLKVYLSGWTSGDNELYVKKGSLATTSPDKSSTAGGTTPELITIVSPQAADYYIRVYAYSNSGPSFTIKATYSTATVLANDVAVTGLSATQSGEKHYKITVPAGQGRLEVALSGWAAGGDPDLYVRQGSLASVSDYSVFSALRGTTSETVVIASPVAADFYIMIRAYQGYSNLTLKAKYEPPAPTIDLQINVPASGGLAPLGEERHYKITVPAGQEYLNVYALGWITGNADLYVRRGSRATTSTYDASSTNSGTNAEQIMIAAPTADDWYVMVRAASAYSGFSLGAIYGLVPFILNDQAVSRGALPVKAEYNYKISVPSGQDFLKVYLSGWTSGNNELYVKKGSLATSSSYGWSSTVGGTTPELITISSPESTNYYIRVYAFSATTGFTLKATYGTATALTSDVAIAGLSAAQNEESYYKIAVPPGTGRLEVVINGWSGGNADLYVKRGSLSTVSNYDYRSVQTGTIPETIVVASPVASEFADFYIAIRAASTYSGLTLRAKYEAPAATIDLQNNVSTTDGAAPLGEEKHYKITVPASQEFLRVNLSGWTAGNADLYVRQGSRATTSTNNVSSTNSGTTAESVSIAAPAADDWYIMVRAVSAYSGFTLKAEYGLVPVLQNGHAVSGGALALRADSHYKITVPAGQDFLKVQLSGWTSGDNELYVKKSSLATGSSYGWSSTAGGTNPELITVASPQAADYYIRVYAYSVGDGVNNGFTLKATYGTALSPLSAVTLNNDEAKLISDMVDGEQAFKITVPADMSNLDLTITASNEVNAITYARYSTLPAIITLPYTYDKALSMVDRTGTLSIALPQAGDWYFIIRARGAYANATLRVKYSTPTILTATYNSVSLSVIADRANYYQLSLPPGASGLAVTYNVGGGASGTGAILSLYTKQDSPPTASAYDQVSSYNFSTGRNSGINIAAPAAGDWYVMATASNHYPSVNLVVSYFTSDKVLQSGVTVPGIASSAVSEQLRYKITVPANQHYLQVFIWGWSAGDAALNVRSPIGDNVTDVRNGTMPETVTVTNPSAGDWIVSINTISVYTDLSLQAKFATATLLQNGVAVTGITAERTREEKWFKITVPSGIFSLTSRIWAWTTGDPDIILSLVNGAATVSHQDALGEKARTVSNPAAGEWHVKVIARAPYAGLNVEAEYVFDPVTVVDNSGPTTDQTALPLRAYAGRNRVVNQGEMVTLDASQSTGPITTYKWFKGSSLITTGKIVRIDSGNTTSPFRVGSNTITLRVESSTASSTDDLVIVVGAPPTQPPGIQAAQAVHTGSGKQRVTLSWNAVSGSGSKRYTIYRVTGPGQFEHKGMVTDITTFNVSDLSDVSPQDFHKLIVGIPVDSSQLNAPNSPPTVTCAVTPNQREVFQNFTFDASQISDDQDTFDQIQVRWDFDGNGTYDTGTSATNHYYNPPNKTDLYSFNQPETLTPKVQAKDTNGAESAVVNCPSITIVAVNQPPRADAGLDKAGFTGTSVILSGSGSDPDGDPLSYAWTPEAGCSVAPLTAGADRNVNINWVGQCVYKLTVSDNRGGSASDTAVITGWAAATSYDQCSQSPVATKTANGTCQYTSACGNTTAPSACGTQSYISGPTTSQCQAGTAAVTTTTTTSSAWWVLCMQDGLSSDSYHNCYDNANMQGGTGLACGFQYPATMHDTNWRWGQQHLSSSVYMKYCAPTQNCPSGWSEKNANYNYEYYMYQSTRRVYSADLRSYRYPNNDIGQACANSTYTNIITPAQPAKDNTSCSYRYPVLGNITLAFVSGNPVRTIRITGTWGYAENRTATLNIANSPTNLNNCKPGNTTGCQVTPINLSSNGQTSVNLNQTFIASLTSGAYPFYAWICVAPQAGKTSGPYCSEQRQATVTIP